MVFLLLELHFFTYDRTLQKIEGMFDRHKGMGSHRLENASFFTASRLFWFVVTALCFGGDAFAFQPSSPLVSRRHATIARRAQPGAEAQTQVEPNGAKPRSGPLQSLLNIALASPFWKYILVPNARANIVKTAEANGVQWKNALAWISAQDGPWQKGNAEKCFSSMPDYPDYYLKPFHAYEDGNLAWEAAFEQELAGRAVGARNFPAYGEAGEEAFRGAFDKALTELGAVVPEGATIVDFGCGTGTSTRRLAERNAQAKEIVGVDLSPYFITVGKRLLELAPLGTSSGGPWVTTIRPDDRVELQIGDCTSTGMPDACADVVSIGLVMHELPLSPAMAMCEEARRILKPGGQLWISEMDFSSTAFAKQRANPLLFSLIRSTEPYLDEYADGTSDLMHFIAKTFDDVKVCAATGRHYALIATKGDLNDGEASGIIIDDRRFKPDGSYAVADTHLMTWETTSESESETHV